MTSMASGSSRNFTRLGMRRIGAGPWSRVKVVLLIGPYWADEAVVGAVEVAAGVLAVRLRPALVLGLEDAAGEVAQLDQRADLAALAACRWP